MSGFVGLKEYLLSSVICFLLSFVLCLLSVPLLRKLKTGQNILGYVEEHKGKSGTPSMGGISFLLAVLLSALLFFGMGNRPLLAALAVGVGFGVVGFFDDFTKIRKRENQGLTPIQKLVFQTAVAVLACAFCYLNGLTKIYLPFTDLSADIGYWIFPLGAFVFLATVNGVNLTDGLDGLAGTSCSAYFLSMGAIIAVQGEYPPLSALCFLLTAALLAFLLFNTNRASVFMGDTGSLALGGFAACVGLFTGNVLYIAILGITFVFSVISVILQVIYYKKTGKRLFFMAPAHHHFQRMGYSESKIAFAYGVVTLLLGAVCLLFLV